jgi:hypothetical protein
METIVNNDPNLHPVWAKALGIKPKSTTGDAKAADTAKTAQSLLAQPSVAPDTAKDLDDDGWEAIPLFNPVPDGPAVIRKRLSRDTSVRTVVFPGDLHYPVAMLSSSRKVASRSIAPLQMSANAHPFTFNQGAIK